MKFEKYKKYHNFRRDECPVCKNEDSILWTTHEYFSADECSHCGFVYINPSLNQDGLNEYYSDYIGDRFDKEIKMKQRQVQYQIDANFLQRFVSTGDLLDVGCNGGFFLDALSNDFNKTGIEIDADAVKYANENYNFKVIHGFLGDDEFENNSFDVIVFRGVIEHILNPELALLRAKKILRKGGFIYFCATPNLKSIGADFYREKWNLWHPIEHINIFDATTLNKMLGQNDFELFAEDYQYLGTPYENYKEDTQALINDIALKNSDRWDEVSRSKPFWGNMMSLIYKNIS